MDEPEATDRPIERARRLLETVGFDPAENVLTQRQAEVLALRERDLTQQAIAEALGTSRANVSSIEATARENVENATRTVAIAEAIRSPVRVRIDPGVALIDVPERVYAAADETDTKVAATAPELLKRVTQAADRAIADGTVVEPLFIGVAADGSVTVRPADAD